MSQKLLHIWYLFLCAVKVPCFVPFRNVYLLSLPIGREQALLESQEQKCTAKMELQVVQNS